VTLATVVLRQLIFHRQKTLPVILLCGLILLLPAASGLLAARIATLADRPLAALDTELILQHDRGGKDPATIRIRDQSKGLMEPFELHSFPKAETARRLAAIAGPRQYSTALLLWRFDPANTVTAVGLDPADPLVGLRKIETLLLPGGRFFSSDAADEVILERHFAKLFGHKPGGRLTLAGRELVIIGLVDFTEQSNLSNAALFLPYRTALALAGLTGEPVINQLFIALDSAAEVGAAGRELAAAFPAFSLISRDSLYQNLSALNRLIYRGGRLFTLLTLPLALLLLFWVLKIHYLEFAGQAAILQILGWPAAARRQWQLLEAACLLAGGLLLAGLLSLLLHYQLLPHLQIGPLLNQGFQP